MPPFTIGVERVRGVGDYDTPSGDLPVADTLARQVFEGVTSRGFDPAISLDLRVDHGITQVPDPGHAGCGHPGVQDLRTAGHHPDGGRAPVQPMRPLVSG
ncbi:hypothetical protein [Streptosporangium amethystogenes]|uniref:hypothetical protein n=1 Tax=Streptosporangium amethystogenes TaxID=2002 RepID=UPI0012F8CF96|nr:hypothetical protein [Streptosporangium amethystogenes]